MAQRRKSSEGGGLGRRPSDRRGEEKEGGQSHTAPRGGRKMGGLVRRTLELEGAGDTGPGTAAPGGARVR
jgi:hypothetical protein